MGRGLTVNLKRLMNTMFTLTTPTSGASRVDYLIQHLCHHADIIKYADAIDNGIAVDIWTRCQSLSHVMPSLECGTRCARVPIRLPINHSAPAAARCPPSVDEP